MARVKRSGTQPEIMLRIALRSAGLNYRCNVKGLAGTPDVVFKGAKIAVFVDGCFWHGCPLHSTKSKTNTEFWAAKIERNKNRDRAVDALLNDTGWHVIRVWEHEIRQDCAGVAISIWATVRTR